MERTRSYGLVLLLTMALLPSVSAEASTQETIYVAGMGITAISCSPEPHPVLPVGEPQPDHPVGWLLSGQPECAGSDASNAVREQQGEDRSHHGYGGAAHEYDSADVGTAATAWLDDGVFGSGNGYLRLRAAGVVDDEMGYVTAEGCGPQTIILPPEGHTWQPWPMPPTYWWAFVDAVGVEDDLTVCFATTGILHATWGA